MARQLSREQISRALRKQVLARDNNHCQKCGRCKNLEIHHIVPSADKGQNNLENLITLCKKCHSEWEHIVYPGTDQITFQEWIVIPPAITLITLFAKGETFGHEITWDEFRNTAIQISQTFKYAYQFGERYWKESDLEEEIA